MTFTTRTKDDIVRDEWSRRFERDWARDAADRAARRAADPAGYAARQAIRDDASRVAREKHLRHVADALHRQMQEEPAEPEMHELPGYRLHLAKDAIVEAFLELRAERQRSRSNVDPRDEIKSKFGSLFADEGIQLVKMRNWVRHERTIMEPRLR